MRIAHKTVISPLPVRGRLITGHTASLADQDAPVIIRAADTIEPGGAVYADARCRTCTASVSVGLLEPDTLVVLEHEAGCAELAALVREAGL